VAKQALLDRLAETTFADVVVLDEGLTTTWRADGAAG